VRKNGGNHWRPMEAFLGHGRLKCGFGIYLTDDFLQLINYERVRADRSDSEFSLVVFEVRKVFSKNEQILDFISTITSKVRTIDHVGWFQKGVGVLLPITSRQNAVGFARAIRKRAITEVIPFAIYSYPDASGANEYLLQNATTLSTKANRTQKRAMKLYDSSDGGRLRVSEQLKSAFAAGIPVWKRTTDIVGSLFGIILLLPLFALLAVYIKTVSRGSVLYKSTRIGRKGESFTFLKFRTMCVGNDQVVHSEHAVDFIRNNKSMEKLDDRDPRIIPGGRILRKLAIDELPQLFNILHGEMSLVGPRPCIPYEAREYLRWHAHRFDVLPGLSGLWQVSGKNKLTFQQMIRLDIEYMNRMSFLFDLYIIVKTPIAIIKIVMDVFTDKHNRVIQEADLRCTNIASGK
jgi:lipopolysaccharide/colanic/teichoic acid biosynthesis glycosyltransferase